MGTNVSPCDTEDFVNIELDSQRNQLIKLELVLTTATLCVTIYGVIAGVFGRGLHSSTIRLNVGIF
jgi:magnesium transporter